MIKKEFSFFMLCIVVFCMCCSCGLVGDQKYECNIDTVKSIQIVTLDKYIEGEYRYEYKLLSEITDLDAFVKKLNKVKHSTNWGDPYVLRVEYTVIKIEYVNGDYDLIYNNAQWFNRSGRNNTGYFCFDKDEFDALIHEYLPE